MLYFIVEYRYLKPPDQMPEIVAAHRAHLDEGYKKGWFAASGPQNPKVGGLLIARAPSRADLDEFLSRDPFILQRGAESKVTEFAPVKTHPDFGAFFREG